MQTFTDLPNAYKSKADQANHPPSLADLPVCRFCGEKPKILTLDPRRETKLEAVVCSSRRTLACTENQFGQILTPVRGERGILVGGRLGAVLNAEMEFVILPPRGCSVPSSTGQIAFTERIASLGPLAINHEP